MEIKARYLYYISFITLFIYLIEANFNAKLENNILLKNKNLLFSDNQYLYLFNKNRLNKLFKNVIPYKWSRDGKSFIFYNNKKRTICIYDLLLKKIIYKKSIDYFKEEEFIDFEIFGHKIYIFFKSYNKKYIYSLFSIDIKENTFEKLFIFEKESSVHDFKYTELDPSSRFLLFYFGDNYTDNNIFVFDVFQKKMVFNLKNFIPIGWLDGKEGFLYYKEENENIIIEKYDFYKISKTETKISSVCKFKINNLENIKISRKKDLIYIKIKSDKDFIFYYLTLDTIIENKNVYFNKIFNDKKNIFLDIY